MGAPKALLEYAPGESFLRHLAGVFGSAGCDVLAVLGHDAARIEAGHPDIRTVRNERWKEGQLSSARLGIARALETAADLVLVHPVDMPTISPATVQTLLLSRSPSGSRANDHLGGGYLHANKGRAAVPVFRGVQGHPLLLPRACAQAILRESAPTLEAALKLVGVDELPVNNAAVTSNINTAEDYAREFGRAPRLV
jgi:molybdenum cofactor cytidylyltransferase